MIKDFKGIINAVHGKKPKKVAVVVAHDHTTLEAVKGAKERKIAEFVLVGDKEKINQLAKEIQLNLDYTEIINEPEDKKAAYKAVSLVSEGKADFLMKGFINTADLLRAVLDKEIGLRTGRILSHVGLYEVSGFNRLLMVTDGGMNISPSLIQKADIIQNAVIMSKALGIIPAKVAILAAVELVNQDMPITIEAAALSKMAERGQIKDAIIDGPLALDNAINLDAAKHKGINSIVAGYADILVAPNLEVGNILGKSLVHFAKGKVAGLILGAAKPVVLTSRADTYEAKIMSIALGVLLG